MLINREGHLGHGDKTSICPSVEVRCCGDDRRRTSDWPVPARMGFAVNRSQLVQSEWKEVAQRGHFVSGSACEVEAEKQNTIACSTPLPPHPPNCPVTDSSKRSCLVLTSAFFSCPTRPIREALLCVFLMQLMI